ncbi:MAG TPA: hypothetical protein VFB96_09250 [Pirellulaceae bacterium]|nr:hypothetical protein [Pirellulaceae bacterium]
MSFSEPPPINPYQAPSLSAAMPVVDTRDAEVRAKIKKFRDQIHALGAFWIIIGGISLGLGIFLFTTLEGARVEGAPILGAIVSVAGACWFGLGVATCLKQLWAVYIGLVLSYLSVLGNLVRLNVCSLIILAAVILQAHRVIGWARELQAAGIPLDAKP